MSILVVVFCSKLWPSFQLKIIWKPLPCNCFPWVALSLQEIPCRWIVVDIYLTTLTQLSKYPPLVYTKTVDSIEGALWLASQTPNVLWNLPWSNSRKKSSKLIFCVVYYLTVLVYTKTTIHLSVSGWRWIFNLLVHGSVNIHRLHLGE